MACLSVRQLSVSIAVGTEVTITLSDIVLSSFSSGWASAQDDIVVLGKAHTRSAPSGNSLPKAALETVPMFVWLTTDHSDLRG